MDAESPPRSAASYARLLLGLRHALADPLSAAVMKLDLVERRLLSPKGGDPSWVLDRVRGTQTDVGVVSRLVDVLLRLAEIAGEEPEMTSLGDVCRNAGVSFGESAMPVPRLLLRPRAASIALHSVAAFVSEGGVPLESGAVAVEGGRVTLSLEGSRATADGRPERLLELPHGVPEAEALFVARAAIEADGGRLELAERGGRLVAGLSWPLTTAEAQGSEA